MVAAYENKGIWVIFQIHINGRKRDYPSYGVK